MLKLLLVLLFLLATSIKAETAYFAVTTDYVEDEDNNVRFIIELKDETLIKHARALLSYETSDNHHIMGRFYVGRKSYNPDFSYYLQPETISFFDNTRSRCDYPFKAVDKNPLKFCTETTPQCFLCPSTSYLIEEVENVASVHKPQASSKTCGRFLHQEWSCLQSYTICNIQ